MLYAGIEEIHADEKKGLLVRKDTEKRKKNPK
jgi:hypothetical protein